MGDVADILGLTAGRVQAPRKGSGTPAVKKPDGVSREVFSLLGHGGAIAPCMPSSSGTLSSKRKLRELAEKPATKWVWTTFRHSGRSDEEIQLKHWQRSTQAIPDYAFARFNKKCAVVVYTEEEFETLVERGLVQVVDGYSSEVPESSGAWTKKDTDKLFSMCDALDLRWFVIADRWDGQVERTVSDLKSRYYTVAKAVVAWRRANRKSKSGTSSETTSPVASGASGGAPKVSMKATAAAENALLDYDFDKEYDLRRVVQLTKMLSRSVAEEKEEARLLGEIRKIDVRLKRLQNRSKESGLLSRDGKSVLHAFPPTLVDRIFNAEEDPREGAKLIPAYRPKRKKPPVRLRSAGFFVLPSSVSISESLHKKMNLLLSELGVLKYSVTGMALPLIATTTVVNAYDKLRQDILKLFALQTELRSVCGGTSGKKAPSTGAFKSTKTRTKKRSSNIIKLTLPSGTATSNQETVSASSEQTGTEERAKAPREESPKTKTEEPVESPSKRTKQPSPSSKKASAPQKTTRRSSPPRSKAPATTAAAAAAAPAVRTSGRKRQPTAIASASKLQNSPPARSPARPATQKRKGGTAAGTRKKKRP